MIPWAARRHQRRQDEAHATKPAPRGEDERMMKRWKPSSRALGLGLAGLLVLAALGAFLWTSWEKSALPRRAADFPPAPKIDALIAAAEAQIKDNPQDISAMVRLGVLRFEKGKNFYMEAVNDLEEARTLGALDARIFYCLGIMYQELGLYPFALEEYQRFLRNRPQDKEVRLLLAKLLYHEGRYREAADEYSRLKFSFPQDSLIEENLALSFFKAKNYLQAAESFRKLKAFGGEAALRAIFYAAQMDCELERYQAALGSLKAVLPWRTSPDSGVLPHEAYSLAASAAEKLKLHEEARGFWEQAAASAPSDQKIKSALKQLNRRFPPKKKKKPASRP